MRSYFNSGLRYLPVCDTLDSLEPHPPLSSVLQNGGSLLQRSKLLNHSRRFVRVSDVQHGLACFPVPWPAAQQP